ncbi:hypothetical protein GCM10009799_41860 [Nocardiopsis rhodophaea]|uniref:Biotin carboxylation domain-containing protein n=1 Tax=Nocardiopsis rhodophaea TaxID=280238 RepID=A0ABN2THC5_9ACTN
MRLTGEAFAPSGQTAADSYPDFNTLVKCAEDSEADAVHTPGVRFRSENADFADVQVTGLTWVGPPRRGSPPRGQGAAAAHSPVGRRPVHGQERGDDCTYLLEGAVFGGWCRLPAGGSAHTLGWSPLGPAQPSWRKNEWQPTGQSGRTRPHGQQHLVDRVFCRERQP